MLLSRQAPAAPALSLTWPQAWARPAFRFWLLLGVALLLGLAAAIPYYFAYIQARPGIVLPDPFLAWLPAQDVSAATFDVIYLSVGLTVAYLANFPALLVRSLWAYLLMHAFRTLTLWAVPLNPPLGLLLLHDPFVDQFFYGGPVPITKDLFFSGHTATMVLLLLSVRHRAWRWALGLATGAVGGLVLVQHTHYTYDVLAAPFFAWLSYYLAGRLLQRPQEKLAA